MFDIFTAKEKARSAGEARKETADLSTALRSGRDDKVVVVEWSFFHGKAAPIP
jgi:hypothetical protein